MSDRSKDIRWSREVRERDAMCMICQTSEKRLNAHHLIPKNFLKYRWDLENGIALCCHCHNFGKFSAHKNPIWFANWLRENHGFKFLQVSQRLKELE